MKDEQFRELLDSFGYSWKGYKKVRKGVIKRLVRCMVDLQVRDTGDYLKLVRSDPEVRRETRRLMTVSVSRFFRDRSLWTYLKETLIPEMAADNQDGVAVWSAGCALGQEVYSFTMLWRFMEEESGPLPPLSVTATDMNPEYLDRAKLGLYDSRAAGDIPACFRDRFLRQDRQHFSVTKDVRRNISWQVHDLADRPPARNFFHLVFLRNNLLTYYKKEYHEGMVKEVIESLTAGGYLVIGTRETLPAGNLRLREIGNCPGVFRVL